MAVAHAGSPLPEMGARSVFDYIRRTAEETETGVRWQTIDYENQPQYDISVANGVQGISLF